MGCVGVCGKIEMDVSSYGYIYVDVVQSSSSVHHLSTSPPRYPLFVCTFIRLVDADDEAASLN